jgi:hypothetical protein
MIEGTQREHARDRVMTHARTIESVQASLDEAVEPEAFRFFRGLLLALVVSAFLWGVLAVLGYGVYVLVRR